MTAVEWLFDNLDLSGGSEAIDTLKKALEMERQENKIILTDQEIEKAAKKYDIQSTRYGAGGIFIDACKWYRDQLKLKK